MATEHRAEFDLVVDSAHFVIDLCHFILFDAARNVVCRICRDEMKEDWLGAAWHFHDGSDGDHEARPEWQEWNVAEVIAFLAARQGHEDAPGQNARGTVATARKPLPRSRSPIDRDS